MEEEGEGEGYFRYLESDSADNPDEPIPVVVEETKKKRKFSGMRDPDAEVIALSPKTLMATNRFICEICNKGFQRDQNLQLHRRGHNLPWKLRQRTSKDVRKRVYICPETSCVHHDPVRALGDLTGIKKHFCRKHGEKKHRCDRCSKKYAVLSDLKAHVKTCGTREYRCDCGTLFSRRDSFVTHRAFCDALAQETAPSEPPPPSATSSSSPSVPPHTPVLSVKELPGNCNAHFQSMMASGVGVATVSSSGGDAPGNSARFNVVGSSEISQFSPPLSSYPVFHRPISESVSQTLSHSIYGAGSSFNGTSHTPRTSYIPTSPPAALSATALLQKAAQMGTTTSSSSILQVLRPPPSRSRISTMAAASVSSSAIWNMHSPLDAGTATLDFLGLGMGNGGFFNSYNGRPDLSSETFSGIVPWTDDSSERKPSVL